MKHELPQLPYAYDALEPYIDTKTMELHHSKHHQAYIDKLNGVIDKYPDLGNMSAENLLRNLDSLKVEEADKIMIRNHAGGHVNHSLFWNVMNPANVKDEILESNIISVFGSIDDFKKRFNDMALKLFGSGWVWLATNGDKLHLHSLPNQDSPFLHGHTPILGIDLWEHSFYIRYQNRRQEYIENWWKVIKVI